MADSPRIEELRRRVQSDPASIAFAALAEEYRRAGRFEEAIAACVTGLQRHPSYLSAHVTLGLSLLEVGRYEEAQDELEHVLKLAPENLAAIRALSEIHHRRGDDVAETHTVATDTARRETGATQPAAPVLVQPHASIPVSRVRPEPTGTSAVSDAIVESTAVREPVPEPTPMPAPAEPAAPALAAPQPAAPELAAPELAALEEFLSTILRARANRLAGR
jgi:tetratricopeptide (TPR) repeat protein